MRHIVIVGILVIPTTLLTYLGLSASSLMPLEGSAQALIVDQMWNWDMIAIAFLFSVIVVPLAYSLIVFRRRKGDTSDGVHDEGNIKLEVTWTIIPLLLVTFYAYLGAYTLGETRTPDPNAWVVNVTAHQWAWAFQYPEGFSSTELHLPEHKQVLLKMTSLDVIHSFWVPEFRVKQDVLPGRTTELRLTPIALGSFKVRCAELCGLSHAYMEAPVLVTSPADYDAWAQQQATAFNALLAKGGPDAGKAFVAQNGCAGCHSIDGTRMTGPTWRGLFGSEVPLSDGKTVKADDAYLTESIKDPNAKIVAGFPANVMPKFDLTDQQIKSIVSYIETLK
ncbi:MAG TPA: cytochrome c oxidase subunit II [Anaerolineales bacterium]|nr:cytochrome c oxidase subunit II [Anaerolineales bacterium]